MTGLPTTTDARTSHKQQKPMVLLWLDAAEQFAAAVHNSNLSGSVELALYQSQDIPPTDRLECADAVVCWSLAAAQRGGSIQCDPGSSSDPGTVLGWGG